MKRFAAVTFGAVLVATAILAVLGYLSLRHWEPSADLLFREQSRDMVAMAAEKIASPCTCPWLGPPLTPTRRESLDKGSPHG